MKKKDKVYCGQCKFDTQFHYCSTNPKPMKMEFQGPGHTESHRENCAEKNAKNDCSDFKKKK